MSRWTHKTLNRNQSPWLSSAPHVLWARIPFFCSSCSPTLQSHGSPQCSDRARKKWACWAVSHTAGVARRSLHSHFSLLEAILGWGSLSSHWAVPPGRRGEGKVKLFLLPSLMHVFSDFSFSPPVCCLTSQLPKWYSHLWVAVNISVSVGDEPWNSYSTVSPDVTLLISFLLSMSLSKNMTKPKSIHFFRANWTSFMSISGITGIFKIIFWDRCSEIKWMNSILHIKFLTICSTM